jgi:predicted amidohydrolase
MKQGFLPHSISTDWPPQGRAGGVIDLTNVMSKFLLLGMSLGLSLVRGLPGSSRHFGDLIFRRRHGFRDTGQQ